MIAAQFCTNKVSGAHIVYVLITNVINTYALVKYILYIINMCLNKVISLSLSLSLSLLFTDLVARYKTLVTLF